MKTTLAAWYAKTPSELSALWDSAIFVPDTNILLHCLRHSSDVREELLRIFDLIKGSLWIPYQVGLEFHRNRIDVQGAAEDAYDRLVKEFDSALNQAREKLKQLRAHPSISVDKEISAIDTFATEFRSRMQQAKVAHPTASLEVAMGRITSIFEGRVGQKPSAEKLAAIRKEGEDRYAKKIPPGFKDAGKDGADGDKFGDLIIWKELMEKAKSEQRGVVLITDDAKEDWWYVRRGKKLGPRPELVEEFFAFSGQYFHVYEFSQFLRFSTDKYAGIPKGSVERIEKSLLEDDQARRRAESSKEAVELRERLNDLENERDRLIANLSGIPAFDNQSPTVGATKSENRSRLAVIDREIAAIHTKLEEFTHAITRDSSDSDSASSVEKSSPLA